MSQIVRFLFFNVVFAVFPLLMAAGLRSLAGLEAPPGSYASELFFLSVMLGATTIGDLVDERRHFGNDTRLIFFTLGLLFMIAVAAALYGFHLFDSLVGPGNAIFRSRINRVAAGLSILMLVATVAVEYLLAKIRKMPT